MDARKVMKSTKRCDAVPQKVKSQIFTACRALHSNGRMKKIIKIVEE